MVFCLYPLGSQVTCKHNGCDFDCHFGVLVGVVTIAEAEIVAEVEATADIGTGDCGCDFKSLLESYCQCGYVCNCHFGCAFRVMTVVISEALTGAEMITKVYVENKREG